MTGNRLLICGLLMSCLLVWSALSAVAQDEGAQVAELQRQVRRLEAQVEALRAEQGAPGVTEVVGGLGYIVGIFGAAAWLTARKQQKGS